VVHRREGQDGVQERVPSPVSRLAETDISHWGAGEMDRRTKDDHIRFLSHGASRCIA
jgi:hypothetical protein